MADTLALKRKVRGDFQYEEHPEPLHVIITCRISAAMFIFLTNSGITPEFHLTD